ncbi:thymidylate synthase, partial [Candidatus Roizmanbacteria bacterium CG_4_10_14_0_8_um_filter_39_9]
DAKFAKKWGNLPKIYGELWRKWPTRTKRTIDQLKWVIQEIKDDPAAHNLIVNSWNPEYLYTMATLKDASRFPICHNMYQVNIIDGKLSLQLYQRSADIFLGVPFNIASYALLTLILAKVTGYKPGEFIHTFGDVHIYEMHTEQVKEQLKRKPNRLPNIYFNHDFSSLDDFKPEYVNLNDYIAHPPIKASLSVTGGLYDQNLKLLKKIKEDANKP